ncbi:MAG: chemotaxis protein CheW [Bacteriovoracaceae bacterium]
MSKSAEENAFNEFFAECEEILQRVSLTLTNLEEGGLKQDDIDSLYRDVHTMKGSAQLFGFQSISLIAHAIEASLEPVRKNKIHLDKYFVDLIFKCLDLVDRIVKQPSLDLQRDANLLEDISHLVPLLISVATNKMGGEFQVLNEMIPDDSSKMIKLPDQNQQNIPLVSIVENTKNTETKSKDSAPIEISKTSRTMNMEKNVPATEESHSESSTIRVNVSLLDKLMNLIGEMVLTRNQVLQFSKNSEDNEFLSLTQRLDLVTTELQDNVMKTRMQPIGSIFSKFQRVVRDLSRDLGKNIDLIVQGAETELDKSLIEAIKDPLTHIVRNSCDHGIESIADRKSTGKSENGVIQLKAYHEGGQVIIEIKDDGKGIDPKKIREKALEKRIISSDKAASMTDKEAQELIFAAGFSTAVQVTSVSGRGVGMDVVKNNVEKVGGAIELESVAGQGTTLRLKIPLTLAIVPAMVVRSGSEFYAIPQVKVQELLRVDMEDKTNSKIECVQGQEVYRLRGNLLPLISCEQIMTLNPKKSDRKIYNIAVLHGDQHDFGLIVDEICDNTDIVVKPLPNFLKKIEMFSGATIMGDGSVALIMNTQGIIDKINTSHVSDKNASSQANISSKPLLKDETEYLLFKLNHQGTFALPLVLVHRLEEFDATEIDNSGDEKLIKYRGSLLPLISLNNHFKYSEAASAKKVPVVVVSKNNRMFGFMVDEIVDILTSTSDITSHIKETSGLLGSVLANDKMVITVIDTYRIIDEVCGIKTDLKSTNKKKNARVLLAEDTMFFVKQIKKVLESHGFEVVHAPDGAEALKVLKASERPFDFVLSDIEMPNLNGFNLALAIREQEKFKNLPLIALTTRFTEADRKRGKEVGFNRYLEKLKSDELLNAIDEILERAV